MPFMIGFCTSITRLSCFLWHWQTTNKHPSCWRPIYSSSGFIRFYTMHTSGVWYLHPIIPRCCEWRVYKWKCLSFSGLWDGEGTKSGSMYSIANANVHFFYSDARVEVCKFLPSIHVICRCTTSSLLFGIGKGAALKNADRSVNAETICDAGEQALISLYGEKAKDIRKS